MMTTGSLRRSARRREERGATTAEYVAIVAFAGLLAVTLLAFTTPIGGQAKAVVSKVYCKIGTAVGSEAGCSNDDLPGYVPTTCQLSSNQNLYGGSVAVVAEVGGDTGYTILRIRERQDDGSYKDKYVVKTHGSAKGSWEFGPKGGAEVSAGDEDSGGDAEGGLNVTVSGEVSGGSSYSFESLEDAQKFADDNKDNFGGLFGVDGGPEADSTTYQAGGGATVSGDAGPVELEAGGRAVLGVTTHNNGDTTFSMQMTASAAADLGIPIPNTILKASARGEVSLSVQADVTFDDDGNVVGIKGNVSGTAEGTVSLGLDGEIPESSKGADDGGNITTPNVNLDAGGTFNLGFDTTFRNSDGSLDYSGAQGLTSAFEDFVSGRDISPDDKAAIQRQIEDRSQVTFTVGTYDKDTDKWGGKVKTPIGNVGAEGHHVSVDQNTTGGWYYNPTTGEWQENLACGEG